MTWQDKFYKILPHQHEEELLLIASMLTVASVHGSDALKSNLTVNMLDGAYVASSLDGEGIPYMSYEVKV